MPVTDASKIISAVPAYKMDQIIGIVTASFAIGAGGGGSPVTAGNNQTSGLNVATYHKGLWSVDNGTTWFDMNGSYLNGTDPATGQLSLSVVSYMGPTGQLSVNATNTTTSAYTILYKVALLARIDSQTITPVSTALTLNYKSNLNYMKIYKEGIVNIGVGGSSIINHGLNKIPNINCWNSFDDVAIGDNLGIVQTTVPDVVVDNNNLTISNPTGFAARNFHYRIYLDA